MNPPIDDNRVEEHGEVGKSWTPEGRRDRVQEQGFGTTMALKSLLLCSDDKIVRVLRRVLGDLEIEVELCPNAETALRKLTRQRFEAIIATFGEEGSSEVLRSVRSAPCNKHAVAIAIVEPAIGLKSVFDGGAHFVLYKPVTSERAKSTFRAARALMKSERRRNARIPVQVPVSLRSPSGRDTIHVKTTDLGEGGIAVTLPRRHRPSGIWQVQLTLPGASTPLEFPAEFAWEGSAEHAGLRFVQGSIVRESFVQMAAAVQLRQWLKQNSPDAEQDDPPIRCRLTDLSPGGCYLEVSSPFPARSRVTLSMKAAEVELRVPGLVRVMHPDKGMGVEFAQATAEQRTTLEKFLDRLTANAGMQPEVLVQPEGMESEPSERNPLAFSAGAGNTAAGQIDAGSSQTPNTQEDPLLQLFSQEPLASEAFEEALRQHRAKISVVGA